MAAQEACDLVVRSVQEACDLVVRSAQEGAGLCEGVDLGAPVAARDADHGVARSRLPVRGQALGRLLG